MKRRALKWIFLLCLGWLMAGAVTNRVGAAQPFFFIQLSDPQFGMFADNANFVQETANFEFAVATINRLKPAFVAITGDLVNKAGDAAQIAEYRRILDKVDPSIPVYSMAGNHDIENVPTPETVAAYTNRIGPDHYVFRHGDFVGVVLNSTVIHSPQKTPDQFAAQERWLKEELERAREAKARHIVVFQHHPWCIVSAEEPDQYFNIPRERRDQYLAMFREYGVKYLFGGHYHRNAVAKLKDMEVITTGPVGKPMGGDVSGLRVAIVRDDRIDHRYYHFGEIPTRIDLKEKK